MIDDVKNVFLTEAVLNGGDWKALELAVSRLLLHCGWRDIQYVGQTGDKGADILAVRPNPNKKTDDTYLIQVKSISSISYVGQSAIDQAIVAQTYYRARIVVVATNGDFTKSAYKRQDELVKNGYDVRLWNGKFLVALLQKANNYSALRKEPREYQHRIINSVINSFNNGRTKQLFVVATGLGKTTIAAALADYFFQKDMKKIIVLCHATDLAFQLQKEFWGQISKAIPTRLFMEGEVPIHIDGINFGLYQSLFQNLGGIDPYAFDLIIVDEAHHALANAFSSCINHLKPKLLIGMTATPWRGDGASIESIFGEPIERISLVDGMRMGYLAKVDYKLMCDNIDWNVIPKLAKKSVTIYDLNKTLFLPQRDDAVIAKLLDVISEVNNPRIAVFSPSKKHAEIFAKKLVSAGIPAANLSINDKTQRRQILLNFSAGKIEAITAVDVLNEGIDIPNVNILIFLRATHSRRIFVQQLGRGLRIYPGKDKVIVLDFVSDIRRIAAVTELDKEAKEEIRSNKTETVILRNGIVTFSNTKIQKFIDAWLTDVTDLQDLADMEKLAFPSV